MPATQGETLRHPHPPVQLHVGQVFANKDALYGQVAHHSAQQDMASSMWGLRKKIYRSLICAHAKTTGCDYLVRARATGVPDAWRITELRLQHTCKPGELAPRVGALRFQFREHQLRSSGVESETKSKTAISLVEQQTGVQMSRRSTNRTLNGLSDDEVRFHAHEWACLPDFLGHCASVDPEGTYVSRFDANMRPFSFFAPSFFKKQFPKHIRPMLGVDAAFTKTCVDHHIIIASSYDANSDIFPLAWAFASGSENGHDWRNFFECLKDAYPCIDKPGNQILMVSDPGKGLLKSSREILPNTEHVYCSIHLQRNVKERFHQPGEELYQSLAYATNEDDFMKLWNSAKDAAFEDRLNDSFFEYLWSKDQTKASSIHPRHWSRAFTPLPRFATTTSNIVEQVNSWVMKERKAGPISFTLAFIDKLSEAIVLRGAQADREEGAVPPRVFKKLEEASESASAVFNATIKRLDTSAEADAEAKVTVVSKSSTTREFWEVVIRPYISKKGPAPESPNFQSPVPHDFQSPVPHRFQSPLPSKLQTSNDPARNGAHLAHLPFQRNPTAATLFTPPSLECSCQGPKDTGLPCSHATYALEYIRKVLTERQSEFDQDLVKRFDRARYIRPELMTSTWSKTYRNHELPTFIPAHSLQPDEDVTLSFRWGHGRRADKRKTHGDPITEASKKRCVAAFGEEPVRGGRNYVAKGRTRCGYCRETGHNVKKCPMKKAGEAPAAAAGNLKREREKEKDSDEETGFDESGSVGEICLAKERGCGEGKAARDRGDSVVLADGKGDTAHPGVSQLASRGDLDEVPTISPASRSERLKRYASI